MLNLRRFWLVVCQLIYFFLNWNICFPPEGIVDQDRAIWSLRRFFVSPHGCVKWWSGGVKACGSSVAFVLCSQRASHVMLSFAKYGMCHSSDEQRLQNIWWIVTILKLYEYTERHYEIPWTPRHIYKTRHHSRPIWYPFYPQRFSYTCGMCCYQWDVHYIHLHQSKTGKFLP